MLVGLVIRFTLFMFPCACRRFKILTECTTNWKKCPFCPLLFLFFPFLSVVIQCCVCSNLATFFGTILSLILIGWYLDCKVDPCDEFMTSISLETYYEVPCSEVSRLVATSRRFYQEIFFYFLCCRFQGQSLSMAQLKNTFPSDHITISAGRNSTSMKKQIGPRIRVFTVQKKTYYAY